jgi:hypothetical protein
MDSKTEIEFIPEFSLDDDRNIEDMVNQALDTDPDLEWEKNKKSQRCVIIDIDGTLADVRGGVGLNKKGEFDWDNFFGAIPYYPPNEWCVRLTQIYYQMGYVVYIVTGRPTEYQEQTEGWLAKYHVPYDFLYMRPLKDKRVDEVVKKEILDTLLPKKELIEFVVDDRPSVVEMWRKEGLTVLACNPHTFIPYVDPK